MASEGRDLVGTLRRARTRASPAWRSGARRHFVRVHAIYSAGIALLNQLRAEFRSNRQPELDVQIEYEPPAAVAEGVREPAAATSASSPTPSSGRACSRMPLREGADVPRLRGAPRTGRAPASCMRAAELDGRELIHFTHELPAARHIRSYLVENGAEARVRPAPGQHRHVQEHAAGDGVRGDPAAAGRSSPRCASGLLAAAPLEPALERPDGHRLRPPQPCDRPPSDFAAFLVENAGPMPADDERSPRHGEAA